MQYTTALRIAKQCGVKHLLIDGAYRPWSSVREPKYRPTIYFRHKGALYVLERNPKTRLYDLFMIHVEDDCLPTLHTPTDFVGLMAYYKYTHTLGRLSPGRRQAIDASAIHAYLTEYEKHLTELTFDVIDGTFVFKDPLAYLDLARSYDPIMTCFYLSSPYGTLDKALNTLNKDRAYRANRLMSVIEGPLMQTYIQSMCAFLYLRPTIQRPLKGLSPYLDLCDFSYTVYRRLSPEQIGTLVHNRLICRVIEATGRPLKIVRRQRLYEIPTGLVSDPDRTDKTRLRRMIQTLDAISRS